MFILCLHLLLVGYFETGSHYVTNSDPVPLIPLPQRHESWVDSHQSPYLVLHRLFLFLFLFFLAKMSCISGWPYYIAEDDIKLLRLLPSPPKVLRLEVELPWIALGSAKE